MSSKCLSALVAIGLVALMAGCSTPKAADFRGKWRPVNQFAETPVALPLHQSYLYQAAPVDATLKGMLSRWAKDSKMGLSYLHPSDYTLHAPVAQIRTYSLQQATDTLNAAYAAHGVVVRVEGSQIVVSQAGGPRTAGAASLPGDQSR